MTILGLGLTNFLAIYGAVVSTISIILGMVLAIRELSRDKRRIKVYCNLSEVTDLSQTRVLCTKITIVNIGHRPIEVHSASIVMSNHQCITHLGWTPSLGRSPLPKTLSDGESVTVFFDQVELEKTLVELRRTEGKRVYFTKAVARDAVGKEHTGKLPQPYYRINRLTK